MGVNVIRFGFVLIQGFYKVVYVDELRDLVIELGKVY